MHGSDKCYGMRKVKIEATFCTNTWSNLKKATLSYTFGSQFRWLINMGLPSSDFISMHVCHIFEHGFEQWPLSSTLCGDSHGPEVTAVHRLFRQSVEFRQFWVGLVQTPHLWYQGVIVVVTPGWNFANCKAWNKDKIFTFWSFKEMNVILISKV